MIARFMSFYKPGVIGRKELGQEGRMWAAGERGGDLGRAGPAWVLGLGWFSIYLGFSLFYF